MFNVLFVKSYNDLYLCYTRIDDTHIVKLVCHWKCLTDTNKYRLKRANCLDEFEKLLLDILTVSMGKTKRVGGGGQLSS